MERPPIPINLYHAYHGTLPVRSKSANDASSLHGFGSALNLSLHTSSPPESHHRLSTESSDSKSLYGPPTTAARWAHIEAAIDEVIMHTPARERSLTQAPKSSPCPIQRSIATVRQKRAATARSKQQLLESTDHTSRTHDFRRFSVSHIPIFDRELPPIDFSRPPFDSESVLSEVLEPSLYDSDEDTATDTTFQRRTTEVMSVTVPQPPTPNMDHRIDGATGGVAYHGREELRKDMDLLHSTEAMEEFLKVARGRWRDR